MQKPAPVSNQNKKLSTRYLEEAFSQSLNEPVTFVNTVFREAVNLAASDILFEPQAGRVRLRLRIDGVLYEIGAIDEIAYAPISARIKVLGKLDSMEKRRIQEGQFTLDHDGRTVNLRLEIVQTIHGEMIVVRVHEKQTIVMELSELGFNTTADQTYQAMLKSRSGLILVCGPTGCGKTTTLYSTLSHLNRQDSFNVMTVEDPVEFQLSGINQMQTREESGFTFAEGLRTILRLSPDIIFVGEIRDKETAEIAIESGLTGQLVFSSIHAPDAVGTLYRLLDLGIETYVLNSSLIGIVAQRLIRKTCYSCMSPYTPATDEVKLFQNIVGRPPNQLVRGHGCSICENLAYKGRTGLFEVLMLTSSVRDAIRHEMNEDELRSVLVRDRGFTSLLKDGLMKAENGLTTIEEVMRNNLRFF